METGTIQEEPAPASEPIEPAPPITNRFLFVDVAALRAKQLRRGARARLEPAAAEAGAQTAHRPDMPQKPERVAMEEVKRGLVHYTLPQTNHDNPEAER